MKPEREDLADIHLSARHLRVGDEDVLRHRPER